MGDANKSRQAVKFYTFSEQGFTLIELLVVLVLIGLVMAIAVPNIRSVFINYQKNIIQEEIEKTLEGLPYKTYLSKQQFKLDPNAPNIVLPSGFSVTGDSTLTIRADGLCLGGRIDVYKDDLHFIYQLNPPLCKPQLVEAQP